MSSNVESRTTQSSIVRPSTINPIDDDLFILYQWAVSYKVPVNYLYIVEGKGKNVIDLTINNIKSMKQVLQQRLSELRGESDPNKFNPSIESIILIQAIDKLNIEPDKAIMLYTDISLTSEHHPTGFPLEGEEQLVVTTNDEDLINELKRITSRVGEPMATNLRILLIGRLITLGRISVDKAIELLNRVNIMMTRAQFIERYNLLNSKHVYNLLRQVANLFYEQLNRVSDLFSNINTFHDRYKEWKNRYYSDISQLTKAVNSILAIRQSIINSSPLTRSNFDVENITMFGSTRWNLRNWLNDNSINPNNLSNLLLQSDGEPITISDGYELFDIAIATENIPYIKYNVGHVVNEREERVVKHTLSKVYYTETGYISPDRQGRALDEQNEELSFHMDYENIVPAHEKSNEPDTMYLTVWLGEGTKSVAPKDSYTSAIYDLSDNRIELEVDVKKPGDRERVKSKVYSALPLSIVDWEEGKMTGKFRIFNLEIEHYSFLTMIRIYRQFSNYFYIEELDKPSAAKSQIYLHFQSPLTASGILKEIGTGKKIRYLEDKVDIHSTGNVRVIFNQLYSKTGDSFVIDRDGTEVIEEQERDTPYVEFKVQKIMSNYELQRLMTLMVNLMQYYRLHKDRIMNINYSLVPLLYNLDRNLYNREQITSTNNQGSSSQAASSEPVPSGRDRQMIIEDYSNKTIESSNEILKNVAPDIFIDNFATKVQRSNQPLPILSLEDRNYWENRTISDTDSRTHQVMKYPPNDPNPLYLVCPNEEYPFPGLRPNPLENKARYPCLPSCYKKDQMSNPSSTYNICSTNWQGIVEESVDSSIIGRKSGKRKESHIVNINKRVASDRRGDLANHIVYLLRKINRDSTEVIYQRYGIKTSPNSIIHAILKSMDAEAENRAYTNDVKRRMVEEGITENYLTASEEEKEIIVRLMRKDMASKINYDILRQENYDMELNQVRQILANPDIFLDPARYYRALEEYFTITLFTFVNKVRMPSSDRKGFEIKSNQLEIPHHSKYYVRRKRPPTIVSSSINPSRKMNRVMILIFKFKPTVGRGTDLPAHCEFIVRTSTTNSQQLFGYFTSPSMINGMFDLFYRMASTYQWSIKPTCHISSLPASSGQSITNCNREGLMVERSLSDGDFINLRSNIQNSPIGVTLLSRNTYSVGSESNQIYKDIAIAQLIDDYGKCRSLLYRIQSTSSTPSVRINPFRILAMIPPTQPYNLPLINPNDITKPSFDQVNNYLASPITGVTYSEEKSNNFSEGSFSPSDLDSSNQYNRDNVKIINGLWYSAYGRTYGVYIPIRELRQNERLNNLPAGKRAPAGVYSLFESRTDSSISNNSSIPNNSSIFDNSQLARSSKVNRLVVLNKINNAILSILDWLFKLSNEDVEDFIKRLVNPTLKVDPIDFYNFDNLNYKYPIVNSFDEAWTYIDNNSSGLIRQGQIVLYNENYYRSVTFFLRDMATNMVGLRSRLPLIIAGSYSRLTDFRPIDNNLIFMSIYDLNNWIRGRKNTLRNNLVLRTTLNSQMSSFINPYLYSHRDKEIYLVQNVENLDIPIKDYYALIEANPDLNPERILNEQVVKVPSILTLRSNDSSIAASSTATGIPSIAEPLTVTGAKTHQQREEENRLRFMLIARARALQVAITWRTKLINSGYNSSAYIGKFPSHSIYEIVEGQSVRLRETYSGQNQDNPYNLIAYTDGYAAMLSIA